MPGRATPLIRATTLAACISLSAACASFSKPTPQFYPNQHFQDTPETERTSDIAYCESLAEQYVKSHAGKDTAKDVVGGAAGGAVVGVVGGAIAGDAGAGAAMGAGMGAAAGLVKGVFDASKPSANYMQFVNRCLNEKGYEVYGWSSD